MASESNRFRWLHSSRKGSSQPTTAYATMPLRFRLPPSPLTNSMLAQLVICHISPKNPRDHVKSKHPSPSAATSAAASPPTAAPTAAPTTAANPSTSNVDYLTPNRNFLATIGLNSLDLHHVHSQAICASPRAAIPCIDVVLLSFLRAATADLDDDVATLAIHALPRLLLAPPSKNIPRSELVDLHRRRTADLAAGHAAQLWSSHAHDWLATLPSAVDFPSTTPEQSAARLINTLSTPRPTVLLALSSAL